MHKQRDIKCWGCPKLFANYSTLLVHLETDTCITTRIELDKLAMSCASWKDYVMPGCEAHLERGDRAGYVSTIVFKKRHNRFGCSDCERSFSSDSGLATHITSSIHHPLAYQCAGCASQYADVSALLTHVESGACDEGITYGTGGIGRLLQHLWRNLGT